MDSKIRAKYGELLKGSHYEETLIAEREDEEAASVLADRMGKYFRDIGGKTIWAQLCLDNEEDFWPMRGHLFYIGGASVKIEDFIKSEELSYPHVRVKVFNKGQISGLADLIIEDFPEFKEYRKREFYQD